MIDVDEMLIWLHGQIDPHNPRDPKYAELWKQIDAIRQAKADIMAAQPPKPIIVRGCSVPQRGPAE